MLQDPRMPDALRSSLPLSLAILGSRVLGLVREMVFAALFGAGAIADAYQVAFRVPNLLRDLFAEGALSAAFVPTFTAALEKDGRARAEILADLVMSALLVVTGLITTLALIFAHPLVSLMTEAMAGDAAKLALAAQLTQIMLPILVMVSLAAVWMGMLNAQRRFVVPALAPALFNVVSIAVGVGLAIAGRSATEAIVAWSIGTMAAGVAQALIQLVALMRTGYRPRLRLRGVMADAGVRRIVGMMAPAVIGIAAVNVNVFTNTMFAAELGDGPVAQLSYAFRLFYLPLGVFGMAIATVTMTEISAEAARGDRAALVQRTRDGAWASWMLTSASAVGMFVLAEPIVRLVFRWGATSAADASAIAAVLQCYVIGLVPYSLVKLYAPVFYGIDRARVPMVASIVGVAVNLAFNWATHRELGAPGIALGTTLGALVNVAILWVMTRRIATNPTPGQTSGTPWLRNAAALVVASTLLAAIAWGCLQAGTRIDPAGAWGQRGIDAIVLGIAMVVGFLAFALVLRAFGYPGAARLVAMPAGLIRRLRRRST
jgi:putative peptidoglycan lipid II flippase